MILLPSPDEVRKAAAFVEALAKVERDFGYRLALGHEASLTGDFASEAVTFGPEDRFVILRSSDDELPGGLALAVSDVSV